jgi:hypothetical protein
MKEKGILLERVGSRIGGDWDGYKGRKIANV